MAHNHNKPVRFAQLLTRSQERISIEPEQKYQQITVRMWGKGVVERGIIQGSAIAAPSQFVARTGQFIMSRIDARNGAYGLVPATLDGAVVTNDFPLFSVNTTEILPEFLAWMSKTRRFVDLCIAASEGTTNRVRLQEDRFLATEILLPPLDEQLHIVARIEALAGRVAEAQRLRAAAIAEVDALLASESHRLFVRLFTEDKVTTIGHVVTFRGDLLRPSDGKTGLQRFVGLQHVESHTGEKIGEDWVLAEDLQGRKFRFSTGEVVYGYLRPYLNKVWIADGEGLCSVDQYILRPDPTLIDTHYLAYFMRSPYFLQRANELTHNLMLPRLRSGLLESIEIPVPSLAKQQEVVLLLDKLHAKGQMLKNLQSATQAELDALLPAILDKAFRGEL